MSIVVQGVIHGTTIQLHEHPGVADGQESEGSPCYSTPQSETGRWNTAVPLGMFADVEGF